MPRIKSFSVEKGDMFYIKHGSSNFTVIDCNLLAERREIIVDEIIKESKSKDIRRFISTHPDDDHIHGLEYLNSRQQVLNFYCVDNEVTKDNPDEHFVFYCQLRDSDKAFKLKKGCRRCWMNEDDEVKRYGQAGINVLWPIMGNSNYREALRLAKMERLQIISRPSLDIRMLEA